LTSNSSLESKLLSELQESVNRIRDGLKKFYREYMGRRRGKKYLNNIKQRITDELEKINFKSYEISDYLIKIRSRDVEEIEDMQWGMLEIRPFIMRAYIPSKKYIDSMSRGLYYDSNRLNRLLKAYEDLMDVIDKEPFSVVYTFEETVKRFKRMSEAMRYFEVVNGRRNCDAPKHGLQYRFTP